MTSNPASLLACPMCAHTDLVRSTVDAEQSDRDVAVCAFCQFVILSDSSESAIQRERGVGIVGSATTPGRTYWCAVNAVDVLRREGLTAAVWEPTTMPPSPDVEHIANIPSITSVATRCAASSSETAGQQDAKNDIVVASEVLQYLGNPKADIAALFDSISDEGIAVLTTDIYDGSDVGSLSFVKGRGRKWQWSTPAVVQAAAAADGTADFRLTQVGVKNRYRRKRSIFFARSQAVLADLREWFGDHSAALTEGS